MNSARYREEDISDTKRCGTFKPRLEGLELGRREYETNALLTALEPRHQYAAR